MSVDEETTGPNGVAHPDPATKTETRLAMQVRGVSKTFPGVRALTGLDLDVRAGSVHALLGHNGCGKSTLVKCLAGVQSPDPGGRVWIDEAELELGDAKDAERKGLRFVHQDLGIIPQLGAVDNVGFVLGYQRRFGAINWRAQRKRTIELLHRFGFDLDPLAPLAEATPPQRAAVAIVRAIAGWEGGRGVLILDEPTAALAAHEVDQLFALIREVKATGTAVILVSHRLDEVMEVADHVTVLREGVKVWDGPLASTSLSGLVNLIANTEQEAAGGEDPAARREATTVSHAAAKTVLDATDVRGLYLRGIDLEVHEGEVVGVAGLLGSGREELPYIVAGAHTDGVSATLSVDGDRLAKLSISEARSHGIALVPADRGGEGIIGMFTTTENVSLPGLPRLRHAGVVSPRAERKLARRWLDAVHADPSYAPRQITTLSGGNQQKAILARWLSVSPRLLVLSEPTAGVDIGARQIIYAELRARAADGLAVLMASSDIEDLIASCDRIVALRDGHIAGEFTGPQMTKTAIALAMEGAHNE